MRRALAAVLVLLGALLQAACSVPQPARSGAAPATAADAASGRAAPAPSPGLAALITTSCREAAPASPATLATDADQLIRNDPPGALARACALARGGDAHAARAALLDLAWATMVVGRYPEAHGLLDALATTLATTPAAPQADRVLAGEREVALGALAANESQDDLAMAAFERAAPLLQLAGAGQSRAYAASRVGLANALRNRHESGDLPRAAALLDEARQVLTAIGLAVSADMGDVITAHTVLAYAQQDFEAAVRFARQDIALTRQLAGADSPDQLDGYASLVALLARLGRYDEAESALREGLRISDLDPSVAPDARLGLLNNAALLENERDRYPAALAAAERAVAFARSAFGDESGRMVTPLNHHAMALFNLSRLAQAQGELERVRTLARRHANSLGLLRRLRMLETTAALYVRLHDVAAASDALAEGLQLAGTDPAQDYWRGRLLLQQATLKTAERRWPEADALLARAQPLLVPTLGERHGEIGQLRAARCLAQTEGRLAGSACAELERDLPQFDAAPALFKFAAAHALAEAARAQGRATRSRELHLLALAAADRIGTPWPRWIALDALAVEVRASGNRAAAIVFGKDAIGQIEAVRADLTGSAKPLDTGFLVDKHGVYRRVASWLTEDGRIAEALEILRLLHREEYLDFIRGEPELAGVDAQTRARFTPSEQAFRERWQSPPAASAADDQLRLQHWDRQLAEPGALPAPEAPRRYALPQSERPPAGVAVVSVYPVLGGVAVVMDSPLGRETRDVRVPPQELEREIGWALSELSGRDAAMRSLRRLYTLLGAPIDQMARRAAVRKLVLNLDGALRYLPFAALPDGRSYLGERYAIELRTDIEARAGSLARRPALTGTRRVQAFAVSRAIGEMPALPAAAQEVCGIVDGPVEGRQAPDGACADLPRAHGVMPGRAWLNEEFTSERLRSAALRGEPGQRNVLHVGSHFRLRPANIDKSWLLMGDGQRLPLRELATLDLRPQELVTLSACETGMGGSALSSPGAEVRSLSALMVGRGARSVVASLWPVEDSSTSRLMQALYRGLAHGLDAPEALRRAQAAVRGDTTAGRTHPFYWAGFYVASGAPTRLGPLVSVAPGSGAARAASGVRPARLAGP